MIDFVSCQFAHTTADDQRDYFVGPAQDPNARSVAGNPSIPTGAYRVVDGVLIRIVHDVPRENVMRIITDNLSL